MRIRKIVRTVVPAALVLIVALAPSVAGDDVPTAADVQAALDAANDAFAELQAEIDAATLDRDVAARIAGFMHRAERDLIKAQRRLDRGDLKASSKDTAEGVTEIESASKQLMAAGTDGGAS